MVRRDLFDEIRRLRNRMDRAIDELFTREDNEEEILEGWREPLADIHEEDDDLYIKLELPGINKEDIDLNVTRDSVEVKVQTKKEEKEEEKGFRRLERSYKGFYRYFDLPAEINPDETEATYKDGILEIRMEKTEEEKKKAKRIVIK